jgi:hypothetical protein
MEIFQDIGSGKIYINISLENFKMPTKLKPSATIVDRKTNKKTVTHTYAKSTSIDEMRKMYESGGTTPKLKQKIRNEFVRRGQTI